MNNIQEIQNKLILQILKDNETITNDEYEEMVQKPKEELNKLINKLLNIHKPGEK